MEPPTITKHQAKKTISGKKTKKQTIKNVLVKPTTDYWPELTTDQATELKHVLTSCLPRLRIDSVKIPYKNIKNIAKEDRKMYRRSQQPLSIQKPEEAVHMAFGVNDVSICIEQQNCSCILLESRVQPRLLIRHLIDQAVLHNIPVLLYEGLKTLLKNQVGIKSAAFAIKKSISLESRLCVIFNKIKRISLKYKIPRHHIHYHRRIENKREIALKLKPMKIVETIELINLDESLEEVPVENCHLIREDAETRVFVPKASRKRIVFKENLSFIPLSIATSSKETSKETEVKSKKYYKSLVVKRLKGDGNRNLRKVSDYKKKMKGS